MRDFRRRKDGGRFVEDQQVRTAQDRLQDFDALLFSQRKLLHPRVGVDLQPVARGRIAHLRGDTAPVEPRPGAAAPAEHQVLGHRHRLDQREMLVDHGDAGLQRGFRAAGRQLTAVVDDATFVGPNHAEQHFHQRALARTVLTEQADDLRGHHGQVDAAIGPHRAVRFGDSAHLQQRALSAVDKLHRPPRASSLTTLTFNAPLANCFFRPSISAMTSFGTAGP